MRKGILITRGAIIERQPGDISWALIVPVDASVLELAGLMSAFGLYCELEEGAAEIRLLPLYSKRPIPTAADVARFYMGGPDPIPAPIRYVAASA